MYHKQTAATKLVDLEGLIEASLKRLDEKIARYQHETNPQLVALCQKYHGERAAFEDVLFALRGDFSNLKIDAGA